MFLVIALVTVYRSARSTVQRERRTYSKKKESAESTNISEKKTLFVYVIDYTLATVIIIIPGLSALR